VCTVVSMTKLLPDFRQICYKQVAFVYSLFPFVSHYVLTIYRPVGLLAIIPVRAELVTGYAEDRGCHLITYVYGFLSCDAGDQLIKTKRA